MPLPKIIAAQRLQTWLLVTAFSGVLVVGLLVLDMVRGMRAVVIGDGQRSLSSAVQELLTRAQDWESLGSQIRADDAGWQAADTQLRALSYDILESYPDVEGGYLHGSEVIGHSFPIYTEPGSTLRQPEVEYQEVLTALEESRRTGAIAQRILQDEKDLVLVSVWAAPDSEVAAWGLKRYINFSDAREFWSRLLIAAMILVSLGSIATVLRLSVNLQNGFRQVQTGLEELRGNLNYRLPDKNEELRSIVQAVNAMADSRQRMEAELRREDRLRVMGKVVAGIAHEIRNPLNSIRLTIRLLARRLQGQPAAEDCISLVTEEIDRLDSLLNGLLAFRADEPGRMRRQPLRPILERTLAVVGPHARERGVKLLLTGAEHSEAQVDGANLQQALMNLLLNAVEAAGRGGSVAVELASTEHGAEITIQDSGPGFTTDQQDHLFEAFYTTKPGGTGLGLAITRTLLDKMGGRIELVGGRPGAQFRIVLPSEVAASEVAI